MAAKKGASRRWDALCSLRANRPFALMCQVGRAKNATARALSWGRPDWVVILAWFQESCSGQLCGTKSQRFCLNGLPVRDVQGNQLIPRHESDAAERDRVGSWAEVPPVAKRPRDGAYEQETGRRIGTSRRSSRLSESNECELDISAESQLP
jgi:hypothetical protein